MPLGIPVLMYSHSYKKMTSAAVVFGLDYTNSRFRLDGCVSDARSVYDCLIACRLFDSGNIHLYTEETDAASTTKRGILAVLAALAQNTTIRHVLIYFAGHGTSVVDFGEEEVDGRDEAIVPTDYTGERHQLITDDEIRIVLGTFGTDTKVSVLFDCCHSGTLCDLVYSLDTGTTKSSKQNGVACLADITVISSCRDSQAALEEIGPDGRTYGVFTSKFVRFMNAAPNPLLVTTYSIAEATYDPEQYSTQTPVVTSSRAIDRSTPFFRSLVSTPTTPTPPGTHVVVPQTGGSPNDIVKGTSEHESKVETVQPTTDPQKHQTSESIIAWLCLALVVLIGSYCLYKFFRLRTSMFG
jgi:hypothetical protein